MQKMNLNSNNIFSPVNLILIIVNLIVLNLLSSQLFGRIDLTENQVYTLSDVTKRIVRDLEEPLTIKAFFTRDLPAPYNNISRYVEDQIAEMKAYSRGKVQYEFLDPSDEEDLKKEAEKFRLEPIQVNEMRADKVQFKLAYLGIVLIYEDRQEVIPVIQRLENLEYEIVTKIKRVTAPETQTIGFLEGHGEAKLREQMASLEQELRKLYDVKPISFTARNTIADDIDVLCIIGPTSDFPTKDRYAIDQFIMRGGKVIFAYNSVAADLQNMQAQKSALRFDPWTESYGFKVREEIVADKNSPTLPFQMMTRYGRSITMVQYPLFPEVINFNQDIMAMSPLRQVRFYFPGSIDTSAAADIDSVSATALCWSSDQTSTLIGNYDINPLNQQNQLIWDQKNLPFAVLLQGKFPSHFAGQDIPKDEDGNAVSDDELIPVSVDTRIVAIGDANFIQDQYIVPGLDNLTMALNLIDWLAQDDDLISIRSREVASRPIGEVSDGTRKAVKYANLLIPPLLVIGFGLVRWRIRGQARKIALRDISVSPEGDKS